MLRTDGIRQRHALPLAASKNKTLSAVARAEAAFRSRGLGLIQSRDLIRKMRREIIPLQL